MAWSVILPITIPRIRLILIHRITPQSVRRHRYKDGVHTSVERTVDKNSTQKFRLFLSNWIYREKFNGRESNNEVEERMGLQLASDQSIWWKEKIYYTISFAPGLTTVQVHVYRNKCHSPGCKWVRMYVGQLLMLFPFVLLCTVYKNHIIYSLLSFVNWMMRYYSPMILNLCAIDSLNLEMFELFDLGDITSNHTDACIFQILLFVDIVSGIELKLKSSERIRSKPSHIRTHT